MPPESIQRVISRARRYLRTKDMLRRIVTAIGVVSAAGALILGVARYVVLPWAEPAVFGGIAFAAEGMRIGQMKMHLRFVRRQACRAMQEGQGFVVLVLPAQGQAHQQLGGRVLRIALDGPLKKVRRFLVVTAVQLIQRQIDQALTVVAHPFRGSRSLGRRGPAVFSSQ